MKAQMSHLKNLAASTREKMARAALVPAVMLMSSPVYAALVVAFGYSISRLIVRHDVNAFRAVLPRVRIIPIDQFDPLDFL